MLDCICTKSLTYSRYGCIYNLASTINKQFFFQTQKTKMKTSPAFISKLQGCIHNLLSVQWEKKQQQEQHYSGESCTRTWQKLWHSDVILRKTPWPSTAHYKCDTLQTPLAKFTLPITQNKTETQNNSGTMNTHISAQMWKKRSLVKYPFWHNVNNDKNISFFFLGN